MRYFALIAAVAFLVLAPSAALAQGYGDPGSLVTFWYHKFLGREPDPNYGGWATGLAQGLAPDDVLAQFLASEEYYTRSGATPAGFVTRLYNDLLNRAPSSNELGYWLQQLALYNDRRDVAYRILSQNPGVWVGSTVVTPPATVTLPVIVTPGIERHWYRDGDRVRDWDWRRRHEIYEYRRPYNYYHRGEHHHR